VNGSPHPQRFRRSRNGPHHHDGNRALVRASFRAHVFGHEQDSSSWADAVLSADCTCILQNVYASPVPTSSQSARLKLFH